MLNEIEFTQHCICYHYPIDGGRNNSTRKSSPFARGEETLTANRLVCFGISRYSYWTGRSSFYGMY